MKLKVLYIALSLNSLTYLNYDNFDNLESKPQRATAKRRVLISKSNQPKSFSLSSKDITNINLHKIGLRVINEHNQSQKEHRENQVIPYPHEQLKPLQVTNVNPEKKIMLTVQYSSEEPDKILGELTYFNPATNKEIKKITSAQDIQNLESMLKELLQIIVDF